MLVLPTKELLRVQELFSNYKTENCFLLFDANTIKDCDPVIRKLFPKFNQSKRIIIPAGDQYKNMEKTMVIWDTLAVYGAGRNSLLLNVGGGMITDIGGYSASCYKRGIDFVNIPTSLLGMVDASIGGKTGINFRNYKNQIGVFADPEFVFLHSDFLRTLPRNELRSGLAEMIKHQLLFNKSALELILKRPEVKDWTTNENILENIEYKKAIVEQDYTDQGLRQCLNFGHTIGHALESFSHKRKTPLLHGEAVLLGMIEELKLSEKRFNTPPQIRAILVAVKKKFFPFLDFKYRFEKLIPFLEQDKKNDQEIRFSLLADVAKPKIQVGISLETLENELA